MTEIKMPSAGQTTDEATIVAVHVKPGDTIKRGDVLCEAETDKAVLPVESFAAGTALAVLIAALVIWCHRENITRLLHHQERKFQWHTGTPKEKE